MIIKSDTFIYLISWFMKPAAITLWPFIIISPKRIKNSYEMDVILRHEQIHLRQQAELFVIGFYILYVYYYVKFYVKRRSHYSAYRLIPFEMESYLNQYEWMYLKNRQPHAWKRYL